MAGERTSTFDALALLDAVSAWATSTWTHVKMDQQAFAFCLGGLLVCGLIWGRICAWVWRGRAAPENSQLKLLKAVEARVYENELLHERLLHQAYRGKLLKKEMRWLRECLYETRQRLEELRGQQGLSSGSEWGLGAGALAGAVSAGEGRLVSESAHCPAEQAPRRRRSSVRASRPPLRPRHRLRRPRAALSRASPTQPPHSATAACGRHQVQAVPVAGGDAGASASSGEGGLLATAPPRVDTEAAGDALGADEDPPPDALISLFVR